MRQTSFERKIGAMKSKWAQRMGIKTIQVSASPDRRKCWAWCPGGPEFVGPFSSLRKLNSRLVRIWRSGDRATMLALLCGASHAR
ncbi:MAG: hypothetical protein IT442_05055 [Phycisphaeraceae bacterium]|nr:hypothetical protein [Phycisphaeraceae bacterium]